MSQTCPRHPPYTQDVVCRMSCVFPHEHTRINPRRLCVCGCYMYALYICTCTHIHTCSCAHVLTQRLYVVHIKRTLCMCTYISLYVHPCSCAHTSTQRLYVVKGSLTYVPYPSYVLHTCPIYVICPKYATCPIYVKYIPAPAPISPPSVYRLTKVGPPRPPLLCAPL